MLSAALTTSAEGFAIVTATFTLETSTWCSTTIISLCLERKKSESPKQMMIFTANTLDEGSGRRSHFEGGRYVRFFPEVCHFSGCVRSLSCLVGIVRFGSRVCVLLLGFYVIYVWGICIALSSYVYIVIMPCCLVGCSVDCSFVYHISRIRATLEDKLYCDIDLKVIQKVPKVWIFTIRTNKTPHMSFKGWNFLPRSRRRNTWMKLGCQLGNLLGTAIATNFHVSYIT